MYPLPGVTLFEICFKRSVDSLFWVDGFLDTLAAHHGQPCLERLSLLRRHGLDNAEKLLGVDNIGEAFFTVSRLHFQT